MVTLPKQQDIKMLQAFRRQLCLTIYMPPANSEGPGNANRIAFKNTLKEAAAALTGSGIKPRDTSKILRPAYDLLSNHNFMANPEGAVFFIHSELFHYYRTPGQATPPLITVEVGFNLEPLLKIMQDNPKYLLLALSHNNVILYEGDCYNIQPLKLKDFPMNLKRALRIDEMPQVLELHTVKPAGYGKRSGDYHGQYNESETDKLMLEKFFRLINRRLHRLLQRKQLPMIIAGVEYLLPIYHHVNTYPNLLPHGITGNPENIKLDTMRAKASRLVQSRGVS